MRRRGLARRHLDDLMQLRLTSLVAAVIPGKRELLRVGVLYQLLMVSHCNVLLSQGKSLSRKRRGKLARNDWLRPYGPHH